MRGWAYVFLVAIGGCSLVLDTSPPDPVGPVVDVDASTATRCRASADCDDGNPCNGVETCVSRVCVSGAPIVCPSQGCLVGHCKPDGSCEQKPSDEVCNDGAGCTMDSCTVDGACAHRLDDTACDDGLSCTRDICVGAAIAAFIPSGCYSVPDDSLCPQPSTANACLSQVCAPGARDPADTSGCAPRLLGVCSPGMRCNVETAQCEFLPDACDAACDDGVACNGVETCDTRVDPPVCVQSAPPCAPTDATCAQVVCDLGTDTLACATVRKVSTACVFPTPGIP